MKNPLYQVNIECPACGTHFNTSRVKSKFCLVEKRDTDFCVHYRDYNPIFYEAAVCIECGYGAPCSELSNIEPEDAKEAYKSIAPRWNGRDFGGERGIEDAIDAYKLALYCSQLRKGSVAGVLASLCMRLAWFNRLKSDGEEEKRFLANALQQYLVLYDQGRTPEKMDEITLIYLIGELNRRLGNAEEAVTWFNRVVSHKTARQKPLIVRMAREQWSLVRNTVKGE